MHWKLKSLIQNSISLLPSQASYSTYYWLQRNFGGLKSVQPNDSLFAGIKTWDLLQKQGHNPYGKTFFEVGTGRIPIIPIAYWLMGAKRVYTIDINPYIKEELLQQTLQYMLHHSEEIQNLFGEKLVQERFDSILRAAGTQENLLSILTMCQIHYESPCDAANTWLLSESIDFHTSYNVLEHIPPETLKNIFQEGNRIMKQNGLFVHRVDYSDHFSHTDHNITAINFLQYSDRKWKRYAGNRYMYMNRLRHDDFINLIEEANQDILRVELEVDSHSLDNLEDESFKLNQRFSSKSKEILGISSAWIISSKV
ncbi:MAG: hypothetical protein ACFB0E_20725 [Leptolyngbyaceae cyanobacterium]